MKNGISVIIVAKDEAATIARALDSVSGIADEVIVVDSGSTDSTLDIVKSHPLKPTLHQQHWEDDFSRLRNYAISCSNYSCCVVLDGDEYIDEKCREHCRETILTKIQNDDCCLYAPLINNRNGDYLTNNPRIFKPRVSLRYKGKVHEYLQDEMGSQVLALHEVVINHTGYQTDIYRRKNKAERNLRLLNMQISEEPENCRWQYFLLRYIEYDSQQFIDLLHSFGRIPLPYPDSIEVYAFNVKSQFIMYLLASGDALHAFEHAKQLYGFYKDRNTTILYMVSRLVLSLDKFEFTLGEYCTAKKGLSDIDEDVYLYEKVPCDYTSNCLSYIMARLTEISSGYE